MPPAAYQQRASEVHQGDPVWQFLVTRSCRDLFIHSSFNTHAFIHRNSSASALAHPLETQVSYHATGGVGVDGGFACRLHGRLPCR